MWTLAAIDAGWRLFGVLGPADVAIAAVLLMALVIGYWSGLIWQLICLVSVIGCFWLSYVYHPVVAQSIGPSMDPAGRTLASAVGVFLVSLLVCYMMSFLFRGLINAIRPQVPDRIMGAVFGMLVGGFMVGAIAFFVLQYAPKENTVRGYVEGSRGATTMAGVVRVFVYVLPDTLRGKVEPGVELSEPQEHPAGKPEGARTHASGPGSVESSKPPASAVAEQG
jgi:uncharacterized membrane protein required for colicin V production